MITRFEMGWSAAEGGWAVVYARDLSEAEALYEDGAYTIEDDYGCIIY